VHEILDVHAEYHADLTAAKAAADEYAASGGALAVVMRWDEEHNHWTGHSWSYPAEADSGAREE
jgi:hypothetical protein